MKKILKGGVVAAGVMAVGAANAAAGDVDISAVTGAGAQVALVGAAVFAVVVGAKLFKWIRAAL